MKKVLLGSTALVGASLLGAVPVAAAEAPTLSFSGFTRAEITLSDQDLSAGRGRGYSVDLDNSYLNWSASGTTDNGLKYTAHTNFDVGSGDINADEAKLTFGGDWGTAIIGTDDGAGTVMMIGGYSLMTAAGGYDGSHTSATNVGGIGAGIRATSQVGATGDANKVSYYTPRMSGFQMCVSLTPDTGASFNRGLSTDPDDDGDRNNQLSGGVNYNGTVGEIGLKAAFTYMAASDDPAPSGADREDLGEWSTGFTASYAGFSIGAGYLDHGDSTCTVANTLCDQGDVWDVAAQYKFGGTTVATGWLHGEGNPLGAATGDEADVYTLGVKHTFASAPGMSGWAEITQFDGDRDGTASDNEATYVLIGTQISF
jgi:outer membrane protein OmpU